MRRPSLSLLIAALLAIGACQKKEAPVAAAPADSGTATTAAAPAAPAANPLRNAYFGDLHLHTGYSMDAFAMSTRTTPEDSYRYAMGETVEYFGKPQKRLAPLDFLAVTDHAEYLGVVRDTIDPNGPFAKTEWYTDDDEHAIRRSPPRPSSKLIGSTIVNKPLPEFSDPKLLRSAWAKYTAIADKYNKPGKFTAFVGFEWTSAPEFQNLHRCVIFADKGPDDARTRRSSRRIRRSSGATSKTQRKLGLDVIAVPHNGNASNGLMFSTQGHVRQAADPRLCRAPHGERAAGRDHPGQGAERHEPVALAERTSSPTSRCGRT